MKHVSNDTRLQTIDAVYRYCEENNISVVDQESRAMSWDNVREMSANGMEIGSHTLSHPILSRLSADEIWTEVDESRKAIEARTGKECNSLAYPNGGAEDMNEAVFEAVGRSGYRYACSYIPGTNIHRKLSVYSLKRLHVERYTGRAEFAAMLALPEIFGG
jgi:peptidoglycan/xylan/chitin deacetylase (PgdA/CDA1 family)